MGSVDCIQRRAVLQIGCTMPLYQFVLFICLLVSSQDWCFAERVVYGFFLKRLIILSSAKNMYRRLDFKQY